MAERSAEQRRKQMRETRAAMRGEQNRGAKAQRRKPAESRAEEEKKERELEFAGSRSYGYIGSA